MTKPKELTQDEIEELIEEAEDNCRCCLPEQSCPWCRKLAELKEAKEKLYGTIKDF
jgi:hypothetical protein